MHILRLVEGYYSLSVRWFIHYLSDDSGPKMTLVGCHGDHFVELVSRCANLLCDNVVRRNFNLSKKRITLNGQIMGRGNMTDAPLLTAALKRTRWNAILTAALERNKWRTILTAALKNNRCDVIPFLGTVTASSGFSFA